MNLSFYFNYSEYRGGSISLSSGKRAKTKWMNEEIPKALKELKETIENDPDRNYISLNTYHVGGCDDDCLNDNDIIELYFQLINILINKYNFPYPTAKLEKQLLKDGLINKMYCN